MGGLMQMLLPLLSSFLLVLNRYIAVLSTMYRQSTC